MPTETISKKSKSTKNTNIVSSYALLDDAALKSDASVAQKTGVINPYALAEVIADQKIPWNELPDTPKVLSDILQTPYEELFDPVFQGPLYLGLSLNSKNILQRQRSPLLDIKIDLEINDLEDSQVFETGLIKVLADLGPRFNVKDVGSINVKQASITDKRHIQLILALPEKERLQRLAQVFDKALVKTVSFDEQGNKKDWTPPNGTWNDPGDFFNETTEFHDAIQGAVANCYYIAALASVAWAMPYQIKHMTRATGRNQQQFTNLIRFYKPDSNGQIDKEIEVTDAVPLRSNGSFIYARSSEAGEIWPAIYEKAFAKLETGTNGDRPDITATGWGDCVFATAQLTGGKRHYYGSSDRSANDLYNLVRQNSRGKRTFNPMTCWTYSSGSASDQGINYSDANLVASHCYSILGWHYKNGQKYIVLRNPWGRKEATIGELSGTISLRDIGWWRPINLDDDDGTFAMTASAFKTYFRGMGVVK